MHYSTGSAPHNTNSRKTKPSTEIFTCLVLSNRHTVEGSVLPASTLMLSGESPFCHDFFMNLPRSSSTQARRWTSKLSSDTSWNVRLRDDKLVSERCCSSPVVHSCSIWFIFHIYILFPEQASLFVNDPLPASPEILVDLCDYKDNVNVTKPMHTINYSIQILKQIISD